MKLKYLYYFFDVHACIHMSKNSYSITRDSSFSCSEEVKGIQSNVCQSISVEVKSFLMNSEFEDLLNKASEFLNDFETIEIQVSERYKSDRPEILHQIDLHTLTIVEYTCQNATYIANLDSSDFINEMERFVQRCRADSIECDRFTIDDIQRFPILFDSSAATSLTHELFGHMFEFDNFLRYNYIDLMKDVEALCLDIKDNPEAVPELCLSHKDDALVDTKLVTMFENGVFTGELIGGSFIEKLCVRNFRRQKLNQHVYPRMSTLCVFRQEPDKGYAHPKNYYRIPAIKHAKVNHRTKTVSLGIPFMYFIFDNIIHAVAADLTFVCSIKEVLNSVLPYNSTSSDVSLLKCMKREQTLFCGVMTVNWLLSGDLNKRGVFRDISS